MWSWETSPRRATLPRTPCILLFIAPQWPGTLPARHLSYLRSDHSSCLCLRNLGQKALPVARWDQDTAKCIKEYSAEVSIRHANHSGCSSVAVRVTL